ncbi:unnamed protein product, partial [Iphiclides podalirius]
MGPAEFPVTFNGGSYDVKRFLRDHPGGVNTLQRFKGRAVARVMRQYGHSTSAYHMLGDFKVSGESMAGNLTGDVSRNGRIITTDERDKDDAEIEYLEELEGRLDWSKPLLCQLGAVASDYEKWVNSAVYRKCRLFSSSLLEGLTYTPWYLVPTLWIPIIAYLATTQFLEHVACGDSCTADSLSSFQYFQHFAIGVLIWTALEYCLHRWVFHYDPGSSLTLIKIHFLIHGMHHKVPFDSLRQVFPPIPAFVLASIIYSILRLFLTYPLIKFAGGLVGYLTYDMIHYYVHHGSPQDGTYLYAMKRYHSNHHFVNHDRAYGISCKIWDHVFRTYVQVKKLSFSLSW